MAARGAGTSLMTLGTDRENEKRDKNLSFSFVLNTRRRSTRRMSRTLQIGSAVPSPGWLAMSETVFL